VTPSHRLGINRLNISLGSPDTLRTLKITGTSDLIEKVASASASPNLNDLSITFTTSTHRVIKVTGTKKKKNSAKYVQKTIDSAAFTFNIAIDRWKGPVSISVKTHTGETASLPEDIFISFSHRYPTPHGDHRFRIFRRRTLSENFRSHYIAQLEDLPPTSIPLYRMLYYEFTLSREFCNPGPLLVF